jgi:hypothetical protein
MDRTTPTKGCVEVRILSDAQCGNSTVVVCNLAKVEVVGSNPISRSNFVTFLIIIRITSMKGIIKYKGKFYKKSTKPNKKGDLIKLECKRGSDYFKYNGIHVVVSDSREILIPNYKPSVIDGKMCSLCIKLGYNVFKSKEYSKLVEVERKTILPMPVKEEQLCGYTI